MSIAEKLQTISENEQKVYTAGYEKGKAEGGNTEEAYNQGLETGKQSAYDEFWDVFQQNGNRTSYLNGFAGYGWTDQIFKPKYPLTSISNASNMFSYSNIQNIEYPLGFQSYTTLINMFNNAKVKRIGLLMLNKTINYNNTFTNCTKLTDIMIEGVIGNNFDINASPLTKESITSIINALSVDVTGKTVTFSKTAVQNAFGTDYDSSTEWTTLKNSKSNWTITLS